MHMKTKSPLFIRVGYIYYFEKTLLAAIDKLIYKRYMAFSIMHTRLDQNFTFQKMKYVVVISSKMDLFYRPRNKNIVLPSSFAQLQIFANYLGRYTRNRYRKQAMRFREYMYSANFGLGTTLCSLA